MSNEVSMKKEKQKINRKWYIVDATDKILGRLASQIAMVLMGKHKPDYDPAKDSGGFVIVTNCEEIKVTGRKREQKEYTHYTGFMGGLRKMSFEEMLEKKPRDIIKIAVWGMLPKNKTRRKRILRLKIYKGPEHSHKGQKPVELKVYNRNL